LNIQNGRVLSLVELIEEIIENDPGRQKRLRGLLLSCKASATSKQPASPAVPQEGMQGSEAADLAHDIALPECRGDVHVGGCRHASYEPDTVCKHGHDVPERCPKCVRGEGTQGRGKVGRG